MSKEDNKVITLEQALDKILNLQNENNSLKEKLEHNKTTLETLTNDKENLSSEVNRLKQKNFEYFERLTSQLDKQDNMLNTSIDNTLNDNTNVTIDDIINSFS